MSGRERLRCGRRADRVHQDVTCDVREVFLAREFILSVQARKSRAFPTLVRCRTPRPRRTFLFFVGTWSARKRALATPQYNEITYARRVLSNADTALITIRKNSHRNREFFPKLDATVSH